MKIKTIKELVKYIQKTKLSESEESIARSRVLCNTTAWEQDDYDWKSEIQTIHNYSYDWEE